MIKTVQERDRHRAIATITLAFATDPLIRWIFQDAAAYLEHWPAFVEAYGGAAIGSDTAQATDDLTAVTLWLSPGVTPDEDGVIERLHAGAAESNRAAVDAALEEMDAYHPADDHYYLTLLGVEPARQGRGLGSKLLRAGLDRCDQQGLPAYLEATSIGSRDLYLRHDFEQLGIIQNGAMPPMWPMLRQPVSGS